VRPGDPAQVPRPATDGGVAPAWYCLALQPETLLEAVVGETLGDGAVGGHHHRAADQLRILAQQQLPLRIAARPLSALRQLAPGGRGLVDHRLEATERAGPFHQRFRRRLLFPVVDEFVLDPKAVKPPARLPAGIAVLQSVQRSHGHNCSVTPGAGGPARFRKIKPGRAKARSPTSSPACARPPASRSPRSTASGCRPPPAASPPPPRFPAA